MKRFHRDTVFRLYYDQRFDIEPCRDCNAGPDCALVFGRTNDLQRSDPSNYPSEITEQKSPGWIFATVVALVFRKPETVPPAA